MSDSLCPINQIKEDNNFTDSSWYKSIALKWCRNFFILLFFLLLASLMTEQIFNTGIKKYFLGMFFFASLLSLIISFKGYSKEIRSLFIKNQEYMPVCGILQTLYDIIFRPKVLLRDIDVERQKKLGDIYLMFAGLRPAVVITASRLAEIISKDYDLFYKSDPRELNMPFFFEWVGNNNVVLANGKKWEEARALIHTAVNEVNAFVPVFDGKAKQLMEILNGEYLKSTTGNIKLTRWLKAVSLDSAGVSLFGFDFNHLNEESNPGIDAMDYIINEIFRPMRVAFPLMNKLPLKSNYKLRESIKLLDKLVLDMISKVKGDIDSKEMNTVLEILIRGHKDKTIGVNDLRNNIIALVLASHETTQVSLVATLYYLAKFPEHQERLRQEIKGLFPDVQQAFYSVGNKEEDKRKDSAYRKLQTFHSLGNFILESLRLYSPLANQNPRTTTKDTTLDGYFIPQGTLVIMNIHAIHMSDLEWEAPEKFDPNRYKKGTCQNKYAYLPFGAGPRICSGRSFSLIEQKVILCQLLQNFEIDLPDNNYQVPIMRGSFTGLPTDDFQLKFSRIDKRTH